MQDHLEKAEGLEGRTFECVDWADRDYRRLIYHTSLSNF